MNDRSLASDDVLAAGIAGLVFFLLAFIGSFLLWATLGGMVAGTVVSLSKGNWKGAALWGKAILVFISILGIATLVDPDWYKTTF